MRRILMLIAMLALVLNGFGLGAGAVQTHPCAGMACVMADQAQVTAASCAAGSHRCHPDRPVTAPVASLPRPVALEPAPAGPDQEPAPWPWPAQRVRFQPDPMAARTQGGPSLASLPGTLPGILARTCVLRI